MKKINEYLSAKIKINKLNLCETTDVEDFTSDLVKYGFEEIKYNNYGTMTGCFDAMQDSNTTKIFMKRIYDENNTCDWWVRFCNVGELTKNNPMFFYARYKDGTSLMAINYKKKDGPYMSEEYFDTFDQFEEKIRKVFGK